MENSEFKILAFLCWKWGYGSSDMAGTIRAQYPTSIRTILVPCTGRVSTDDIMRAFGKGADGILIVGWYPNECDYGTGNFFALRQVEFVKEILQTTGIQPNRIRMAYCSSAEGQKYQKLAIEFDKEIKSIGHNPFRNSSDTQKKN